MKKIFNFEYFSLYKEIILTALLGLTKEKRSDIKNGRILIVIPCLIGEFAAAIPAIACFIRENKNKRIDLSVTPSLRPLAKKISGVGEVFVMSSAHGRGYEKVSPREQNLGAYEKIILMRMSREAYKIIRNGESGSIQTALPVGLKYVAHLAKNLLLGRTPKTWETVNFEVLTGGRKENIKFEDIFDLKAQDYEALNKFDALKDSRPKIIIHTWTNWPMKLWDNDKWVELLQKINRLGDFKFIFVGAGKDLENYEYIALRLGFEVGSLINSINLFELLLILRRAAFFIGIDSGPRNLAHLADLRSITILGPGPHIFMPSNPADIVIDKTNGRGLFQLYFSVKNSFIKRIDVTEVYEAFKNLYAEIKNEKIIP